MNDRYTVLLTAQAQKDLDRLKGTLYQKALKAIRVLELYPEKGHLLQGSLKGFRSSLLQNKILEPQRSKKELEDTHSGGRRTLFFLIFL